MAKGPGRLGWIGLGAAWALAGSAAAAEPARKPPTPSVSELVVTATRAISELTVTAAKCLPPEPGARADRPKMVRSFPARGAVVRPGLLVVAATFDRPIACRGKFDAAPPLPNPCPGDVRAMTLSYDHRTVRTVCLVEPGREYGLSLGEDPAGDTFIGLSGLPAMPGRISFSTSDGPLVTDACEALAEDEATAADMRQRGKACPGPAPSPPPAP
ncbi:hypothetical protein [Phenylobacterium sp.]|jgi:hypothetical protein|uniref:hypothetical protein n=1 Tax=Phenylobacterium sp. TaxID=1871053 RepID=UPI002F40586B